MFELRRRATEYKSWGELREVPFYYYRENYVDFMGKEN